MFGKCEKRNKKKETLIEEIEQTEESSDEFEIVSNDEESKEEATEK